MAGHIRLEINDAVATVCFDNPPANALSAAILDELSCLVERIADLDSVRAVVFAGVGTVAFLSGADLSEMPELLADPAVLTARMDLVSSLYGRIQRLPQPTIAAVQASAFGGGLEFLLVCDFVVCAEGARLAVPEVTIGLIPGAGGTQRLRDCIPASVAREMLYLGRALRAEEALRYGLVNTVTTAEEVVDEAQALARRLADLPRVAVQAAKRAFNHEETRSGPPGLASEQAEFVAVAGSRDAKEGPSAFLSHRSPSFTHQ